MYLFPIYSVCLPYFSLQGHIMEMEQTKSGGWQHGKLGCVYAVTITAMSILLLREGNFHILVILK